MCAKKSNKNNIELKTPVYINSLKKDNKKLYIDDAKTEILQVE